MKTRIVVISLVYFLFASRAAIGQVVPFREALRLTVMVKGHPANDESGAGIILGRVGNRIDIATAQHVVWQPPVPPAADPEVRFYLGINKKSNWIRGQLHTDRKAGVDLAVISVTVPDAVLQELGTLTFGFLGDPTALQPQDQLYVIGQPTSYWVISRDGNRVAENLDPDILKFSYVNYDTGYSGGPVLNKDWQLVGMALEGNGTVAQALAITTTIRTIREWSGVQCDLAMRTPVSIVQFSAEHPFVGSSSVTAVLSWSAADATGCRISPNVGNVPTTGEKSVTVDQTTQFVLSCDGANGPAAATATVKTPPQVKIASFEAKPNGGSTGFLTTLFWEATDTTNCDIDGGIGTVANKGTSQRKIASSGTLTLKCNGFKGPVTASVSLMLRDPIRISSFLAIPARVAPGEPATLQWQSTNATECLMNPGSAPVLANGNKVVQPTATIEYNLICTAADLPEQHATATVTVIPPLSIEKFTATPKSIKKGERSTLEWRAKNATGCSIEPIDRSSVGASSGSRVVSPIADTVYTLTCVGVDGIKNTANARLSVSEDVTIVSFESLTDDEIDAGDDATLVWTTKGASSCSINHSVGSVDVNGSTGVSPKLTTIYTLTCENDDRSARRSTTIKVKRRRGVACCNAFGIQLCKPFDQTAPLGVFCYCMFPYGSVSGTTCPL